MKRNKNNWIKKIFVVFFALTLILVPNVGDQVHAASLEQPVFAYGESLTEAELEETRQTLGVADNALEMEVRIDELNDLLQDDYPYYQVYSSVYLEPAESETGVQVEILTPDTITHITERQYQNAAITAGAVNMNIYVSSVKAVDGSGALAGVYKAFQESGDALPQVNIQVAQEELAVTSDINEENQGKEDYSDDLLNAAIAEIKAQIQVHKDENNGNITEVNINNIVNNVINNYNLNQILTEENIQSIENLMLNFSQIEFTEEQKTAIADFGQSLIDQGGELLDSAKTAWEDLDPEIKAEAEGFLSGLWQAIQDFLAGIVEAIKGLFN